MTEEIGKVIHDLYEELVEVRKQNVGLTNANKIYSEQNNASYKKQKERADLRSYEAHKYKKLAEENENSSKDLKMEIESLKKENIKLVAQLENDEHNVGHLDEKMKRLDYLENLFLEKDEPFHTTIYQENMKRLAYLEKHVAENRYVFSDIPNTPENLKMVKMMKKYINKRKYTMRWRGQYLIDGENWKKYTYGQPLSKSKCIRVYIDNKPYQIDNVEGFNANEVDTIIDALNCWENELSTDHFKSDTVTQLLNYFESMRLHLENSASKPIKDNVNIVIPKGDKNCHTQ
jgi:hypothetical protein